MRERVPQAVQDCHDLLRWLIPLLDRFPRARRFTLGERLEGGLLDVLADLVDTAYGRDKAPVLAYFPGDDLLTPLARRAGIPIGNLTSQFFANLYLDGLDHAMRARFGAAAYLPYVDDMVVLDDDKGRLRELREAVREHLEGERLRLHPRKAHVSPVREGLGLLGYRVWPQRRRLRNDNGHRFARRLRGYAAAYARGDMDWSDIHPRVRSWVGHAMQADTEGLRRRILSGTVFAPGSGSRDGRRVLRGGSWNNKPRNARSANRNRNDADNRNNNLGFRLVQSAREPGAGAFTDAPGAACGCP